MVMNVSWRQLSIIQTTVTSLAGSHGLPMVNGSAVTLSLNGHGAGLDAAGTTVSGSLQTDMIQDSKPLENSNSLDYDDVLNISGDTWFNFSCNSLDTTNHYVKTILEPLICASGIVGIVLTMTVLSRKTMCTSTNCYLIALAVADLLFLVILSSRIYVDKTEDCRFHLSSEAALFYLYSIIFMEVFHYLSVGITVMLAVERYIAICHPMKAMTICTVKRARIIIIVLTIISFILRSPKFTELEISYITLETGKKELVVTYAYLYNDEVYAYIVTGCLLTFLPLLALTVLNIRLIQEIRRSYRYIQYHVGMDWHFRSVVSREELKMTMMLVSVIIAFFVCHTPYTIYTFMIAVYKFDPLENADLTNSYLWKYFKNVSNILLALKSSCNFVLYCWFSEKFWATFKRIFCPQRCPPVRVTIQPNGYYNNSQNYAHRPSCYITKETTC